MNVNRKALALTVAALALALAPFAAATCGGEGAGHGCSKHGAKAGCCSKQGSKEGCDMLMGAEMKVENLDNGVKITLTSEKPEALKGLQEHAAKCSAKGGDSGMCLPVKGATVETANLTNGVEIHLTSDKPETVKALQEHAAKCSIRHAKGEAGHGCSKMGHARMGHSPLLENAKVEVENRADGATITLTSDDPEVVKAIQAHAAECSAKKEKSGK